MPTQLLLYSFLAGITVFLGALLADALRHHEGRGLLSERGAHSVEAFASGIILAAVTLVLIPRGLHELELWPVSLAFLSGAALFMLLDRWLARQGGQYAMLLAMLLDFVPEAIALGAVFATDARLATLLAGIVGLQNFPEAFNSYRDVIKSCFERGRALLVFFALSFFGVASALLGFVMLSDAPQLTALLMTFAGGGILYLLFEDIIPSSRLTDHRTVTLWAAVGFWAGMVGEKLV